MIHPPLFGRAGEDCLASHVTLPCTISGAACLCLGHTCCGGMKVQRVPRLHRAMRWRDRNTPTGVGKTTARKHFSHQPPETPPRAWGRRWPALLALTTCGNTPTGVGKTPPSVHPMCRARKHPHGRGEDALTMPASQQNLETPPRAWGRPSPRVAVDADVGNTPTGVGKTGVHGW